ncbi:MAG: IS1634 family transposase [Wenzhouxiangella sp.]
MERLETKKINGRTYYYYSKWGWKNGKCRRLWQKYLGSLEHIVDTVTQGGPAPKCADVFQWGLPMAFWNECKRSDAIAQIDRLCPKRNQGLSVGQYLAIAALNRAIAPCSKRSIWEWFSQAALLREIPEASATALSSQRFWDHMDRIDQDTAASIWRALLQGVVERERIDLSSVSYDGTNFYTFIDTFNTRCEIARRGKNKQGRTNLRQVSYALFCCSDGQLPLYYDVYEGNRNDARQFSQIIERFHAFFQSLSPTSAPKPALTVVFDKGNNSAENFALLDRLGLHFVGSVKLDEHKDLMRIGNDDARFEPLAGERWQGAKAFRVERQIAGKARVVLVTYNPKLFQAQWLTLQADIEKALAGLDALQQRLLDRRNGLIKGGRAPSPAAVRKQCQELLKRQHLKTLIQVRIEAGEDEVPQLHYDFDEPALHRLANTYLGKTLLVTTRSEWSDARIVEAYRSQHQIENIFKEMKDSVVGNWWPLQHWTDTKIRVHGLYCTLAVLWRALMMRRLAQAGLALSPRRAYAELDKIKQVINVMPKKRGQKKARQQVVFTEIDPVQKQLLEALDLEAQTPTLG